MASFQRCLVNESISWSKQSVECGPMANCWDWMTSFNNANSINGINERHQLIYSGDWNVANSFKNGTDRPICGHESMDLIRFDRVDVRESVLFLHYSFKRVNCRRNLKTPKLEVDWKMIEWWLVALKPSRLLLTKTFCCSKLTKQQFWVNVGYKGIRSLVGRFSNELSTANWFVQIVSVVSSASFLARHFPAFCFCFCFLRDLFAIFLVVFVDFAWDFWGIFLWPFYW